MGWELGRGWECPGQHCLQGLGGGGVSPGQRHGPAMRPRRWTEESGEPVPGSGRCCGWRGWRGSGRTLGWQTGGSESRESFLEHQPLFKKCVCEMRERGCERTVVRWGPAGGGGAVEQQWGARQEVQGRAPGGGRQDRGGRLPEGRGDSSRLRLEAWREGRSQGSLPRKQDWSTGGPGLLCFPLPLHVCTAGVDPRFLRGSLGAGKGLEGQGAGSIQHYLAWWKQSTLPSQIRIPVRLSIILTAFKKSYPELAPMKRKPVAFWRSESGWGTPCGHSWLL